MNGIIDFFRSTNRLLVTFKVESRLVRQLPLTPKTISAQKNNPSEMVLQHEQVTLAELPFGLPQAKLQLFRACKKPLGGTELSVHANFYWFFSQNPHAIPPNPQLIEAAHLFKQLCSDRDYNFRLYRGEFPRTYRMYCH